MKTLFAALVFTLGLAGAASAQATAPSDASVTWGPVTTAGHSPVYTVVDATFATTPHAPSLHALQIFITGTPTACTFHLYGSLKGPTAAPVFPADFVDLSGSEDCTKTRLFSVAFMPVNSVVLVLDTFTGASSATLMYLGKGD